MALAKFRCGECQTEFAKQACKAIGKNVFCSGRCKGLFYYKAGNKPPSQRGSQWADGRREHHSELMKGENNWNWKGGVGRWRPKQIEDKDWREAVYARDNYTCQECGKRHCALNADHIKPWAYYPELRREISNGRTLCVECHRKTPTYGGRITKLAA